MKLTFLGTGDAEGVPALWCRCEYCQVARRRGGRHLRRRSAVLVNDDLLIDAGPDITTAAARWGLDLAPVRALLITHPHGDHLRTDTLVSRGRFWGGTPLPPLDVYASRASLAGIARLGAPESLRLRPHPIAPFRRFEARTGGPAAPDPRVPATAGPIPAIPPRLYEVWTFAARHAAPEDEAMLFALRQVEGPEVAGRDEGPALLYATDTGPFPEETLAALAELAAAGLRFRLTVVDATFGTGREVKAPGAHMTIEQMLAHQRELGRRGLLAAGARRLATHFGHWCTPPHDELTALLAPHGVEPAYDGLTIAL